MTHVDERFLILDQQQLYFNNVEKINVTRLSPSNNATNLDGGGQAIQFHKGRTNDYMRLANSYLEVTFSYNTESPAGTSTDAADITFENDVVSKLFDSAELKLGGFPIETITTSNIATEMAGLILYSSDEDRQAGYSYGWIPDYGAGSPELTQSGLVGALNTAIPGINVTAGGEVKGNAAARTNAQINTSLNALVLAGTAPGGAIPTVNQNGYFKRKIFYNKPQAVLGDGLAAAGTARTCTLCVPLYHFFQGVTTYDKLLCNLDIDLSFMRSSAGIGRLTYSQVAGTSMLYTTKSIYWCIPYYRLSLEGMGKIVKQISSKDEHKIVCLTRFMASPSTAFSSTSFNYDLGSKANIPRYIIVGAKWDTVGAANQVDQITVNRGLFTHGFITDMYITIGSERYPFQPMNCDFPNNKYAVPYQMFRDLCSACRVSPSMDYVDFRDRFPLFCFDLTSRASMLDTNTTSLSVQISVVRAPPAAKAADTIKLYALQFLE
jgi:hypothetical protein